MDEAIGDEEIYENDWILDTILKYKKLNMYELDKTIHFMELTDHSSMCVLCSNSKGSYEISEFTLPDIIYSENSIKNASDLKLKCGMFSTDIITQMKPIQKEHKLVLSKKEISGISLYNLAMDKQTDEITKYSHITCELVNPSFSLFERKAILVSNSTDPAILVDLEESKSILSLNCCNSSIQSVLQPVFINNNQFVVCYNNCGSLIIQDVRQDDCNQFIPNPYVGKGPWTVNTSGNSINNAKVILLSSCGFVFVFDSRKWSEPLYKNKLPLNQLPKFETNYTVNFSPRDTNIISVSGFDSNVHVYDISNNPIEVFVHEGHGNVEGCESNTVVTSHSWFGHEENYLISSAKNKTIQCWQYET
uniref:WD repeat-containing protein 89 n=1 Tax=Clastoptera arizonana TaxID=38151 RepID=A0A1B6CEM9_9HEMI